MTKKIFWIKSRNLGACSLEKFNYSGFCREDYETLLENDISNSGVGEGGIYIGKVSIGDVLIKLKLEEKNSILAQFFVLDTEALYDQTEDGRPYDNAHVLVLEYSPDMDYAGFIEMAGRLFMNYILYYKCHLYHMSEKILHCSGQRIYVNGEVFLDGKKTWIQSAATVLEDETFEDSVLKCHLDDAGCGVSRQCVVPLNQISSPFITGYFEKIRR